MDFLSDILGGVASGGIFGLVGSIIGVGAKYFQEKQRQAWEQKKWDHESKLLELQMQVRAAETEQELAIVSQTGAWAGLDDSLRADRSVKDVHTWVNDLRALFRPALTVLLWAIGTLVFYLVVCGALIDWLKGVDIADLIRYMVFSVFFSASTATVWLFSDHALTPPAMKNR